MLMARMYDPDSGEIFIDDLPLKTYEPEELRMHMSVLPQEFCECLPGRSYLFRIRLNGEMELTGFCELDGI